MLIPTAGEGGRRHAASGAPTCCSCRGLYPHGRPTPSRARARVESATARECEAVRCGQVKSLGWARVDGGRQARTALRKSGEAEGGSLDRFERQGTGQVPETGTKPCWVP